MAKTTKNCAVMEASEYAETGISDHFELPAFESLAIMDKPCPNRYTNWPQQKRLEQDWERDQKLFDGYIASAWRHDSSAILALRRKEISRMESFLDRSFSDELNAIKQSKAASAYLQCIGQFDISEKARREVEIEIAKQNLLDTPCTETLREYQKALEVQSSDTEEVITGAMEALGLAAEQVNLDCQIIAEFRSLKLELADNPVEKAESERQKLAEQLAALDRECISCGVNPNTSERYQRLRFELNTTSEKVRRLQEQTNRLAELSSYAIIMTSE
jgi:hypothetical protein